jgi:hypothetical protein
LSPEEFQKLKNDIQLHGQQEPIVLSQDGTVLLDGRHRLRACRELRFQPRVERFCQIGGVTSPASEADFIWSKNVLRRHLTDDQRAALGLKWADTIREAAKQRMKDGGKGLVNPPNLVHTRETVAKKAGVSTHKVRQAERVAKYKPELLPKIESGEMKLKDADKETLVVVEHQKLSIPEYRVNVKIEDPPKAKPKPPFNETKLLNQIEIEISKTIIKLWPTNRDTAPLVQRLRKLAYDVESAQIKRSAELEKKIQSIGVQTGAL